MNEGFKLADIIGACCVGGILIWFFLTATSQGTRENSAYERGRIEVEMRNLQDRNLYQQGKIDGLYYGR